MSKIYEMQEKWAQLIDCAVGVDEVTCNAMYSLRPKRIPRKEKKRLMKLGLWPVYIEMFKLNNLAMAFDSIDDCPMTNIIMDYYE